MNKDLDALIEKYLAGTIREDESQQLSLMLRDPENQLRLASRIDEQYHNKLLDETGDEITGARIFQGIERRLKEAVPERPLLQEPAHVVQIAWYRRKAVRSIAVAASLILLIGLGLIFFNNKPGNEIVAVQTRQRADSTISTVVHHEFNTSGTEKNIKLSDGSLVVLSNNSEVTFNDPLVKNRDITLVGKANFVVAKDTTKPFRVFSGDITTTALGTEFTVTAFRNTNQVTVQLFEGKVVIKPLDQANRKMTRNVYLLPGQEFVYDGKTSPKVRRFKVRNAVINDSTDDGFNSDHPSLPQNYKGSWYMFNNQSLGQVFDQLSRMYEVEIIYSKSDVQNKYFAGKFNKSDSLEIILKYIATANQLTITKKESTYTVTK